MYLESLQYVEVEIHAEIYEGYPEINFRSHVEHEVVEAACRGCTVV
jgi:hypothetical protein